MNVFEYLYKPDPLLKLVECGISSDGQFYRLYSDGYCIQGASRSGANCFPAGTQITLLKPYKNISYTIVGYGFYIASRGQCGPTNIQTTGFTMTQIGGNLSETQSWMTIGWCEV